MPRLRILELFEKSEVRHLSAEDVYKMLVREGTDTGLATVYRVLTQFEQAGLLIRHHFESGKAVFELKQGGHHDHIVCIECGHVEEFYDPGIEKRQIEVAVERGHRMAAREEQSRGATAAGGEVEHRRAGRHQRREALDPRRRTGRQRLRIRRFSGGGGAALPVA